MLNLMLNPWSTNATLASISWRIQDLYNDGIKSVEYRIRKENATGTWLTTAGSSGLATLNITNYTGRVLFDIKVTDFSDNVIEDSSEVAVANFIPPTPPDWLSYEEEVLGIITFKWGVTGLMSPTVASWRLINTDVNGNPSILAERPVYERQAEVAASPASLHLVTVVGVDSEGFTSEASPVLSFSQAINGPRIKLDPWQVTTETATINWAIVTSSLLQRIHWTLTNGETTLSGDALPIGKTSIPVKNFVGKLIFTLTATDNQRRTSTITSTVDVYNRVPGQALVRAEIVGVRFIQVKAVPPVDPEVPVDVVVLYGPTGPIELRTPFLHTYEELTPSTDYRFSVKAVNRSGIAGPLSTAITVRTNSDPLAPVPGPEPTETASILDLLFRYLTLDVRAYLLQLYTDTRIRNPLASQIVTPPPELDVVLDWYLPIAPRFGDFLRSEASDQETYAASELIDKTGDPLEKLAIFCERLDHGFVLNLG